MTERVSALREGPPRAVVLYGHCENEAPELRALAQSLLRTQRLSGRPLATPWFQEEVFYWHQRLTVVLYLSPSMTVSSAGESIPLILRTLAPCSTQYGIRWELPSLVSPLGVSCREYGV